MIISNANLEAFLDTAIEEFGNERIQVLKEVLSKKGMIKTGRTVSSLSVSFSEHTSTLSLPLHMRFLDMNIWRKRAMNNTLNRLAWGVSRKEKSIIRRAINKQFKDTRAYNRAIWGGLPGLRDKISDVLKEAIIAEVKSIE